MEELPRNNIGYANSRAERSPRDEWSNIKDALTRGCDTAINKSKMLNYCRDHNYGGQTPIPHEYIGEIPNSMIAVSDEVHQFIDLLRQATESNRLEYPFVLTGFKHNTIGGTAIVLNEAIYMNQSDYAASEVSGDSFTHLLIEKTREIQGDINKNNTNEKSPIICIGHTHPAVTRYYGTTDLGDLKQLMNINSDDGEGNNRSFGKYMRQTTGCNNVQFIQCTIMQNGDVNFMNYDKTRREFRKFSTVADYDKKTKIQSYTFDTPY